MKYSLYFLCLLFSISGFSQDTISRSYVPLQQYVKLGKPLTRQDTLNFRFRDQDTLVLVAGNFLETLYYDKVWVEYEPKDSLFLEIYKDVVYGKPNSATRNSEIMKYWKEDLKVYFDPSVPKPHQNYLLDFANKIATDIDSLNISRVNTLEESNYHIYYLTDDHNIDHDPRIKDNPGGYYVSWKNHQIYNGALKINTNYAVKDDHQLQLLTHYFIGSLGYFKSSDNLECESYLSSCSNYRKLTQMDLEILKYHYSYGICKNVNIEDFEKMHKEMQNSLLEDPNAKLYVIHKK